jgi:dTDP-4-dehydrorhamnose 3,5-epimerase
MTFEPLPIAGAFRISLQPHGDTRGAFARTWCLDAFKGHGIEMEVVQANFSQTRCVGTIRGMHHQLPPKPDAKIVRCTRGRIFEVIADVRPDSPSFGQWVPTELGEDTFSMVYVPPGCAQGFQSLTDTVVVEYFMGERYEPALYSGFRYDDPLVAIKWPLPVSVISAQDLAWPPLHRPASKPQRVAA